MRVSEDQTCPECPRVLAFVCGSDSTIESIAAFPGDDSSLVDGVRLLDAVSTINENAPDLAEQWKSMTADGVGIQSEVFAKANCGQSQAPMLLHAMPLHLGVDEGKVLVTLCSGFRAVAAGPDEIIRCRAVLNTAVDAIVTIDSRAVICSVNPAALKMFGYSDAELIGQNVAMLMPEPFRSQHDGYVRRYLEGGNASVIGVGRQVTGRKKDGHEFPIHLAVSEFSVRGSRFFTGVIRDLSELQRVQAQLLQSERLAAIGQMVTGLAHESRNSLQRAQACLDMLSLDLQDSPELLSLARRATVALQDLHRLYEEVRGYAAPIHLEIRDCDIGSIWRKEWDNLAAIRTGKDITLMESAENGIPRCEVDVHRMEQVFRNVLENAIHACAGKGCITIHCTAAELQSKPAVRISVADDGAGMTPEVTGKVFEPFFTTKQKGTGLGMAIVQRIMHAHDGLVSAGALQQGGAEIVLVLPVKSAVRNAVRC